VIYDAAVVPSYALLVVNIGPNEAKVEAVMNDFVQLHPRELVAEVERQAFEFGDDADSDEDADTRCASPTVLSDVSHARSFVRLGRVVGDDAALVRTDGTYTRFQACWVQKRDIHSALVKVS